MWLAFTSIMWGIGFLLAFLVVGFVVFFNWNRNYWKKRGVFCIEANIIKGILTGSSFIGGKPLALEQIDQYKKISGRKYVGFMEGPKPGILICDPELIRLVLVKDFEHFVNRRKVEFLDEQYFGKMLTNMRGQEWRNTRSVVSPAFTGNKMKMMIELIKECGEQLEQVLGEYADRDEALDVRDIFGRCTMDSVASTAFGIKGNTLRNPDAEFNKMATSLQKPSKWRFGIVIIVFTFVPFILKWIKINFIEPKVMSFFVGAVKSATKYREENNVRRNDFLQLMMDARKGKLDKDSDDKDIFEKDAELKSPITKDSKEVLSDDAVLIGQSLLFLVAGFDPVALLLSYATYELALQPEIQERLRDEIREVCEKHGGKCTYEGLQEMRYLDMVIQETLRKYPAAVRGERECNEDWQIPGTNVTIEKGTLVAFPIIGLHYDPKYYPDPEKFDPDRFLPETKATRSPYVHLPFGSGPRNCVGMRFALLEAKVVLIHALRNLEFVPCEKTPIPLVFEKYIGNMSVKGGTWLKAKRYVSR